MALNPLAATAAPRPACTAVCLRVFRQALCLSVETDVYTDVERGGHGGVQGGNGLGTGAQPPPTSLRQGSLRAAGPASTGLSQSHPVGGVANCWRRLSPGGAASRRVPWWSAAEQGLRPRPASLGHCNQLAVQPGGLRGDRGPPVWAGRRASPPHAPVGQLLGDEQVPQVVLGGALVVLQQRVRVAQAVAGLRLHRLVLELPGQLQSLPGGAGVTPGRKVPGSPSTGARALLTLPQRPFPRAMWGAVGKQPFGPEASSPRTPPGVSLGSIGRPSRVAQSPPHGPWGGWEGRAWGGHLLGPGSRLPHPPRAHPLPGWAVGVGGVLPTCSTRRPRRSAPGRCGRSPGCCRPSSLPPCLQIPWQWPGAEDTDTRPRWSRSSPGPDADGRCCPRPTAQHGQPDVRAPRGAAPGAPAPSPDEARGLVGAPAVSLRPYVRPPRRCHPLTSLWKVVASVKLPSR